MSAAERRAASERIGRALALLPAYGAARTVMFFLTHGSEVETEAMISAALAEGKSVVVPRIDAGDNIRACRIDNLDQDVVPGKFGIREPRAEWCQEILPGSIDLVMVPAVVYDRCGNRIGYGKGYYDRWLAQFAPAQRIGLAYDVQVVDKILRETHDMPVGMIVTDQRLIHCDGRKTNDEVATQ